MSFDDKCSRKGKAMILNAEIWQKTIEAAKAAALSSPGWMHAIEEAASALIAGELIVTTLVDGALVTSASGTYHANGHCTCAAAKKGHEECCHRAAARLVEMYEAAMLAPKDSPTKPAPRQPRITCSIETDHAGVKLTVTRCDGWMI
jgi:hypothetical protein